MCPTLVVKRGSAFLDDDNFTSDARLKYLPPNVREEWKPANDFRLKNMTAEDFGVQPPKISKIHRDRRRNAPRGRADPSRNRLPEPVLLSRFSLHDELALFVRAGLTPFEALQTATVNPAKYLGMEKSLGTIEKGKLADLVLLDANPLENIGNTRKIAAVVMNGRYLPKETLEQNAERSAAKSNKVIMAETPEQLIQRQVEAYNRHDLEEFLASYSSNVQILKFPTGEVLMDGLETLRANYGEWLSEGSTIRAEIVSRVVKDNFVIDKERISGMVENKTIEAVAIYEVRKHLIVRVWFILEQ